ncbi:hypothetical protein BGX38DRAFT_119247 [Terfezia claveryi]|nr:hypothetical protein BGX38DRAFT_119247 [Terfezia claveryi]
MLLSTLLNLFELVLLPTKECTGTSEDRLLWIPVLELPTLFSFCLNASPSSSRFAAETPPSSIPSCSMLISSTSCSSALPGLM